MDALEAVVMTKNWILKGCMTSWCWERAANHNTCVLHSTMAGHPLAAWVMTYFPKFRERDQKCHYGETPNGYGARCKNIHSQLACMLFLLSGLVWGLNGTTPPLGDGTRLLIHYLRRASKGTWSCEHRYSSAPLVDPICSHRSPSN